jgi:selenide, water dikinase
VRLPPDPRVLVGTTTSDDAGVVALTKDLALVQTVDFFPPMVDDPTWFGRVAAANALSDVYAMGGTPHSCVDVLALPADVPDWIPGAILNGAIEKVVESGAALVGGHTITDRELKFGLAVTGTIHPDRIVTNAGSRPGDVLVLTKPLGSGFLCTAIKREALDDAATERVHEVMATLNRAASEAMVETGVSSATDITGFGLIGHAFGMAEGAGVTLRLDVRALPRIEGLDDATMTKHVCGGLKKNLSHAAAHGVRFAASLSEPDRLLAADPQTSGGLLIAVARDRLSTLLDALGRRGVATRAVVGDVVARTGAPVEVG